MLLSNFINQLLLWLQDLYWNKQISRSCVSTTGIAKIYFVIPSQNEINHLCLVGVHIAQSTLKTFSLFKKYVMFMYLISIKHIEDKTGKFGRVTIWKELLIYCMELLQLESVKMNLGTAK